MIAVRARGWGGGVVMPPLFYECARRRTFLTGESKVPNPFGSGKDITESKGAYREVESEGSWM